MNLDVTLRKSRKLAYCIDRNKALDFVDSIRYTKDNSTRNIDSTHYIEKET